MFALITCNLALMIIAQTANPAPLNLEWPMGLALAQASTVAYSHRVEEENKPAEKSPKGEVDPAKAEAMRTISGSPWPGVIDHLLQSPLPGESREPNAADIQINYPSLGYPAVDADIRHWVMNIAKAFVEHLDLSPGLTHESNGRHSELSGDAAGETDAKVAKPSANPRFELWGSYSVSRPSPIGASITFELWNYTGASHGNLDILTLNYNLLTGQRLDFMDLFEKPNLALELMSLWARSRLAPRLGPAGHSRMFEDGTAPLVENFSSLTLIPQGLRINFQPFQVAPWASGIQTLEMPLEELLPAKPLLALWGR